MRTENKWNESYGSARGIFQSPNSVITSPGWCSHETLPERGLQTQICCLDQRQTLARSPTPFCAAYNDLPPFLEMGLEWNCGLMISLTSHAADDNLITPWVYMKCIQSLFQVIKTNPNDHTNKLTWWFSFGKWTHWPHQKDSALENLEEWNMSSWLAVEEGVWPLLHLILMNCTVMAELWEVILVQVSPSSKVQWGLKLTQNPQYSPGSLHGDQ